MTPDGFRRIAQEMPFATEGTHMDHPDFRVGGKIFATLPPPAKTSPNEKRGMVRLTPKQQREYARSHPSMFEPVNGAWGKAGCTYVRLAKAGVKVVREAMTLAWQNTAPKELLDELNDTAR